MCRPAAVALAAALLVLAAGFASAMQKATPYDPTGKGFSIPESQKDLYSQLVGALTAMASGSEVVVASAAPPTNVTTEAFAAMLGNIVAMAAQPRPSDTLGDPKVYPYPDGSGRVALYRFPRRSAKGTCIFVHGCKHDPFSWFYRSPRCPMCTGLPEEVSHTKQCLANGYAVLALMSLNREYRYRCFSSSGWSNDQPSTRDLIRSWARDTGMSNKKMYMFGISSGASFAVKFPSVMPIDGIVSEVNMPWEKNWGMTNGRGKLRYPFPPTVFFMMERDLQTKRQIEKAVDILRNNGVPSDYVYIKSQAISPRWLSMRSVYLTPAQGALIRKYLIRIGVLRLNGEVRYDVRLNDLWTTKLPKYLPWLSRNSPYYNLISDESQIWQELNLAWAWHEIVSDPVTASIKWLESRGRADLGRLVKQYDFKGNIACLTENSLRC